MIAKKIKFTKCRPIFLYFNQILSVNLFLPFSIEKFKEAKKFMIIHIGSDISEKIFHGHPEKHLI